MKKKRIRDEAWFPMATAICIGVVLYILLLRFAGIYEGIGVFIGFFKTVIFGCVIAYLVNPLANLFNKLFKRVKKDGTRKLLSNGLAFVVVILFLIFAVLILVPQLIESVQTFANNLSGYITSASKMLEDFGVSKNVVDLNSFVDYSEDALATVYEWLAENAGKIVSAATVTGKGIFQWVIAFILSIYLLAEKENLKAGFKRLLKAVFGEKRYGGVSTLLCKCDTIFNRYIVFNLIDSLIVGAANTVFMMICGMQYVGLISFVVAITNLIPTFGPMIGLVIGGFVLLMVNPIHALIFAIFTLVLQLLDGYVIKPRLFGNSLGVSGLWILIGVIVGGNMFGVVGILLAVPCVAIIILIYESYILPALEKRFTVNDDTASVPQNTEKE
ncbi:MAG: AI-2E family transporter [Clostridia bacterium]|nr:AI-2E family transporter [Clostridia bacterium]